MDWCELPPAPPAFEEGKVCEDCGKGFGLFGKWRHHCRNCGKTICDEHSKGFVKVLEGGRPLPKGAKGEEPKDVRVCFACHERIANGRGSQGKGLPDACNLLFRY